MDPISQNGEFLESAERGPILIFFGVSMSVELARTNKNTYFGFHAVKSFFLSSKYYKKFQKYDFFLLTNPVTPNVIFQCNSNNYAPLITQSQV